MRVIEDQPEDEPHRLPVDDREKGVELERPHGGAFVVIDSLLN
jgi:hypothetical protein